MNTYTTTLDMQLNQINNEDQYVVFSIDNDEFGIEIARVQEMIGYVKPTFIPNMADFMNGVINLRGIIIPIIDLRKKFNMQKREYHNYSVIIILEVSAKIIGIIVDEVSDVITIKPKDIQDISEFAKFDTEYLKGMGKVGDKLVIMLNIQKILSFDECKSLDFIEHN